MFVDQNPAAVEVIRKNLTAVQFRQQSVVLQTDAQSFLLSNRDMYDIAFLDPPYGKDLIPQALEHLPARMSQAGIILCEHARSDQMPQQAEDFMIDRQYRYGRSMVTVYRRGGQEIE